jgi:hypothetical protein
MSVNVVAPLDPTKILNAMRNYWQKWYEEFASEYERQHGYDPRWFVKPVKWETMSEFTHWNDNELPHVVVACPGFMEPPTRRGTGQTDVCLLITFVVACGSNEREGSYNLALGYGQILGWIGDECGDAETDFIREVRLVDLDYAEVEPNASVASAAISFEVDVYGFLTGGGPPPIVGHDPRDDPYEEPPEDYPFPPNQTELEVIKVTEIN